MPAFATIRITGPDAATFLQGQLTNDVRHLDTESEILAAWCNPKGRVICFGPLHRIDDGYEFRIAADMADDVVRRLTMFRFRANLDIAVADAAESIDPVSLIESGLAFIGRDQSEKFTPHMLNLDLVGAISFDKGCYTGQEVVARTHYKGATKRRALRFSSAEPVSPGDKVSCEGRDVGEVLNVAGNDLLAVVPTDKGDEALSVNGIALKRLPLAYL
jgi:folate-binding protein YgfZ